MLRRTVQGINRDDFQIRTGYSLDRLAGPDLAKFVGEGLIDDDGLRLRFTREGRFLADRVLSAIV